MNRCRIASYRRVCWWRTFDSPDVQADRWWRHRWCRRLFRTLERRLRLQLLLWGLLLLLCRGSNKPLSWNEFKGRGIESAHLEAKTGRIGVENESSKEAETRCGLNININPWHLLDLITARQARQSNQQAIGYPRILRAHASTTSLSNTTPCTARRCRRKS